MRDGHPAEHVLETGYEPSRGYDAPQSISRLRHRHGMSARAYARHLGYRGPIVLLVGSAHMHMHTFRITYSAFS